MFVDQQRHAVADRETTKAAHDAAVTTQTGNIATQLINSQNPSREDITGAVATLAPPFDGTQ